MATNYLGVNDYNLSGFNLTTYHFCCNVGGLDWFKTQIQNTDIIKAIGTGFTDSMNFVSSIKIFPYNVMSVKTDVTIPLGGTTITGTNSGDWTYGVPKSILHITKDFDNFTTPTKFYENNPYISVQCYLPFVGFIDLDYNTLAHSNGKVRVDFVSNCSTGESTYTISVYRDGLSEYVVVYTIQCNVAIDIPIGGVNTSRQLQAKYNSAMQLATGLGQMYIGSYNQSNFMTNMGMSSIGQVISNLYQTRTEYLSKGGVLGQGVNAYNNPHSIYFIVKEKKINDYDSFKSYYGKPLNQTKALSSLKGMTFIPSPKLEINNITKEEFDLLNEKLVDGIIL